MQTTEKIIENFRNYLIFFLVLLPVLACLSCASTSVKPYSRNNDVDKIKQFRTVRDVSLVLNAESNSTSNNFLGLQYALFILPLGRIYSQTLFEDLQLALSEQSLLSSKNLQFIKLEPKSKAEGTMAADFSLEIKEISLNAYDWLFMRNLSCEIDAVLQSADPNLATSRIQGEASAWLPFGFFYELSFVYKKCLQNFASRFTDKVNLLMPNKRGIARVR